MDICHSLWGSFGRTYRIFIQGHFRLVSETGSTSINYLIPTIMDD